MAKTLSVSDLHFDIWARDGRDPLHSIRDILADLDALILAGDISNMARIGWRNAFAYLEGLTDLKKVFVIPGNHDYYGHYLFEGDELLEDICGEAGTNFAQCRTLEIGDARIYMCTLWTDMALGGHGDAAIATAASCMYDYERIRGRAALSSAIIPQDTVAVHREHLAWLTRSMEDGWSGRRIIVTHHLPSPVVTDKNDLLTPAYVSDLDGWILEHQPALWLCGHTHIRMSGEVGKTEIRNVSFGYPDEVPPGQEREYLIRGLIEI